MKRYILTIVVFILSLNAFGQAKKPTLMVMPSDVWCTKNGYMEEFDNQGVKELIPNYKIALQTNSDINNIITKIGALMADRGFPLKDLSATLKSIQNIAAENNMLSSKTSGASIAESPIDRLKRTAKADIILELDWSVNTTGPKKTVTYSLRGLDAYTNKQVAAAQGTGNPSFSAELPVLLEEAVLVNMDNFTAQLQNHFDDLFENGREVTIDIMIFDNGSDIDLETEFDGIELSEIIDDWMAENTVGHRFNKSDATETFILYEQVRIPLTRKNGMAMDTEYFVRELRKYLSQAPYSLESKIINRGLGRTALIIGEK
jgi:hypothetical protein